MVKRIEYEKIMRKATLSAISDLLSDVAREGLPGDHHFFITFDTRHPKVEISDTLRQKYSEEMTIVLQHWFQGLSIQEDHFTVTLNFSNKLEPMKIPFGALRSFVDPSVEFVIRLQDKIADESTTSPGSLSKDDDENQTFGNESTSGEILNIENFRKSKSLKDET